MARRADKQTTHIQTGRQAGRQTSRETDRQTDRQAVRLSRTEFRDQRERDGGREGGKKIKVHSGGENGHIKSLKTGKALMKNVVSRFP